MYEIHGWGNWRARAVGVLLEEEALDYVVAGEPRERFGLAHAPPEGERRSTGRLSEAMMWLAEGSGRFLAPGHDDGGRAQVTAIERIFDGADGSGVDPRTHGLRILDLSLRLTEWLSARYSILDMAAYVHVMQEAGAAADDYPRIVRWMRAMALRPAVGRGMAVGGGG